MNPEVSWDEVMHVQRILPTDAHDCLKAAEDVRLEFALLLENQLFLSQLSQVRKNDFILVAGEGATNAVRHACNLPGQAEIGFSVSISKTQMKIEITNPTELNELPGDMCHLSSVLDERGKGTFLICELTKQPLERSSWEIVPRHLSPSLMKLTCLLNVSV